MITNVTSRDPRPGELCDCGRDAVTVYIVTSDQGTTETPYCGISDGGQA